MTILSLREQLRPFNLIPDVERIHFVEKVLDWYENFEGTRQYPAIYSDAIYMCKNTQYNFNDYLSELHYYHYALKHMYDRLKSEDEFPIPFETFTDDEKDGVVEDDWQINQWLYEMSLYKDITKVMDYYHMFYIKDFSKEPDHFKEEPSIHNMPIKGVW